ncbi:hypothetical protein ACOHYD_09365 [Desulfobacterota bacterium M19]
MKNESKIIPVLREGVEIVKMIAFRDLREVVCRRFPERERQYHNKLTGAVINRCFGIVNPELDFQEFAQSEDQVIDDILSRLTTDLPQLRIPLTDALRIMVLCDHQEGVDNSRILSQNQNYGILLVERDLPMPHRFIELVRRIGASLGLIVPPLPENEVNTVEKGEK